MKIDVEDGLFRKSLLRVLDNTDNYLTLWSNSGSFVRIVVSGSYFYSDMVIPQYYNRQIKILPCGDEK